MEAEYLAGEHDPKSPATANLLRGNFSIFPQYLYFVFGI